MTIAQYPGEMDEAKVDIAVARPDGQVIAFCTCERADPGLAEAVECETTAKDVVACTRRTDPPVGDRTT